MSAPDAGSERSLMYGVPDWLRQLGVSGWLVMGLAGAIFVGAWFLGVTSSIMIPLILAVMFGVIFAPIVDFLEKRKVPRIAGSILTLLLVLGVMVGAAWISVSAIVGQWSTITTQINSGIQKLTEMLTGMNIPQSTVDEVTTAVKAGLPSLSKGITTAVSAGLSGMFGLLFGGFLALFMLYLVLADLPGISKWVASHMGLPVKVGLEIVGDTSRSLRGYFRGSTIIGVVNAIVIALGMWALGVPLIFPVAIVTVILGYIPFFGALVSGAFAILIALGANGPQAALYMLIIVLIAQNVVQLPIQAWAMGDALDLHPIIVLVSTMIGGIFGGLVGGMIGAPLTAIAVQVVGRISAADADLEPSPEPDPA